MIRNLSANAGDTGSIPGPGGFQMPRGNEALQLLKPACLEPVLRNKRSHSNEKPMHSNKISLCSPQLESVLQH